MVSIIFFHLLAQWPSQNEILELCVHTQCKKIINVGLKAILAQELLVSIVFNPQHTWAKLAVVCTVSLCSIIGNQFAWLNSLQYFENLQKNMVVITCPAKVKSLTLPLADIFL